MSVATPNVERLYDDLRRMAADFDLKPGERINETVLSRKLGASRTPLREALNRLVAEGFLTFRPGSGFYCRALDPDRIVALYEARVAIECEAVRLAATRASDDAIAAVLAHLDRIEPDYASIRDPLALLQMDEQFHLMLVELAGNAEFLRLLHNLNGRIRYVRLMDLKAIARAAPQPAPTTLSAHRTIAEALARRDPEAAAQAMRSHIERRRDQATAAVREAFAEIYTDTAGEMA